MAPRLNKVQKQANRKHQMTRHWRFICGNIFPHTQSIYPFLRNDTKLCICVFSGDVIFRIVDHLIQDTWVPRLNQNGDLVTPLLLSSLPPLFASLACENVAIKGDQNQITF